MRHIVIEGKIAQGNLKAQSKINKLVLIGFASTLYCMLALFPYTFIDLKIVLGLYFIPSIPLAYKLNKTIIQICGYEQHISNNSSYNTAINVLSYLLIAIFVGGVTVMLFLKSNELFAGNKIETHFIAPLDVYQPEKNNSTYYQYQLEFDNVSKPIRGNGMTIEEVKKSTVQLEVTKGLFGYYIIESRTLIENNK